MSAGGPAGSPLDAGIRLSHSPVMVLSVRQTKDGRGGRAFSRSLRSIGVDAEGAGNVEPGLQGAAVNAAARDAELEGGGDHASVVYLRTTGRKFDELHVQLLADEVGIESVKLSMTGDVELLRKLENAVNDPTTIRHENIIWLGDDSKSVQEVSSELGQLQFLAMPPGSVGQSGDDIDVQVIVLVR